MVADDCGILWFIAPEQLKFIQNTRWLIDVNLAILYLLTNPLCIYWTPFTFEGIVSITVFLTFDD